MLVFGGAQRRHNNGLGFTTGEQRRAVRTRQEADHAFDRTHLVDGAPVNAALFLDDAGADDVAFDFLEDFLQDVAVGAVRIGFRLAELGFRLIAQCADGGVAFILLGDLVGGGEIGAHQGLDLGLQRGIVRRHKFERFLRGLFGQFDDRIDHRLHALVCKTERLEHLLFAELFHFRLDHHDGVGGAGDDEIEIAGLHLLNGRVQHRLAVDPADAAGGDRAHERNAGNGQRGGGGDHGQQIGFVFIVPAQHRDDHLYFVLEAIDEERADRAIDQARQQRFPLGRAPFALEEAARNAARSEILFLVVHGQREKVLARLRFFREHDSGQERSLAPGREHSAVGLTRHAAGLERELAPRPIHGNGFGIEHTSYSSPMSRCSGGLVLA